MHSGLWSADFSPILTRSLQIFHQCADVAIQSQPSVADDGTVVVLAGAPPKTGRLYAATPEQFGPGGEPVPTHSLDTGMFIADGLAAYVESLDTAFYVGGATMEGTLPDTLLALTPSGPKAPKKVRSSNASLFFFSPRVAHRR